MEILVIILGLYFCAQQSWAQNSITGPLLKFLHSLVYLSGLWLIISFSATLILMNLGVQLKIPLQICLAGWILFGLSTYFLRPGDSLVSVQLSKYGFLESEIILRNIESLVETYRQSLSSQNE